MSLLRRRIVQVDEWLLSQLENYTHQYLFNLLLAAGTCTNFAPKDIFAILGPDSVAKVDSNPSYQRPRRFDPLQIYAPKEDYRLFYNMLSEFLKDPVRSKDYHVDPHRYATLSIFIAIFLIQNM